MSWHTSLTGQWGWTTHGMRSSTDNVWSFGRAPNSVIIKRRTFLNITCCNHTHQTNINIQCRQIILQLTLKTSASLLKLIATRTCNIKDVLYLENKCDTIEVRTMPADSCKGLLWKLSTPTWQNRWKHILLWPHICHSQRWRTHFKWRTWVHWGYTQVLQAKCVKTGTVLQHDSE